MISPDQLHKLRADIETANCMLAALILIDNLDDVRRSQFEQTLSSCIQRATGMLENIGAVNT